MKLTKVQLKEWIDNLNGHCIFEMCKGHKNPPETMITCAVCGTTWEMKQAIKGLSKKQYEKIQVDYEIEQRQK